MTVRGQARQQAEESLFIDCRTFAGRVEQVVSVVSGQKTA
jgi:hypothetical protein